MKLPDRLHQRLRLIVRGGPKRLRGNADWVRAHPGTWTEVCPEQRLHRRPPIRFGEVEADFASLYPPTTPAMGLLALEQGRIIGPHGWLVTADKSLLHENTWYGPHFPTKAAEVCYGRKRRVQGTCLSLTSEFATGNYGHFVLDCLGRAAIFLKAGRSFADVDHIYIPKPPSKTAATLLRRLGVAPEKCIWARAGLIQADTVLGTTFPGTRRNYPDWLMDFFRSMLGDRVDAPHRRIYVPRTGPRQLRNEAELYSILERHGFEIYDFNKVEDEAAYFAEAEIVVGAHGAGLTNLIFCSSETKVLELVPSDHIWPYYYTITESAGAQYHYIVGQSLGSRPKGTWGPSPFDFVVDPTTFARALETLCSETARAHVASAGQ